MNGVYTTGDEKQITNVVGFDVSAAFDTICHDIFWSDLMQNSELRQPLKLADVILG